MSRIRLLSADLANQIAAGEVIERPASVVKELIENALDAAAGGITIEIEEAGLGLIRVVDDGAGMDQDDLALAVQRHATSKIGTTADLFAIRTLGFRGEALPSIVAVSRTTIATKTAAAPHGWFITVEGGATVATGKRAMNTGTIIEVRDLFFNTPARRKFLKTPATEQKNIVDIVTRYAVAYPAVSFSLTSGGRQLMRLTRDMNPLDRSGIVLGADFQAGMRPFSRTGAGVSVHGQAAPPRISRPVRSGILCFVNHRAVRDATLAAAVIEGYRGQLMRNKYPMAVLFVDIDPAEVDVNVHPAKAEVRFRDPSRIFGLIVAAIREALMVPVRSTPHAAPCQHGPVPEPVVVPPPVKTAPAIQDAIFPAPMGFYTGKTVIGTLRSTYILLQDADALYILDQHAAHERVLYEGLRKNHIPGRSQALLTPLIVDLSAVEYAAFEDVAPVLNALGIDCAPFGDATIAIRAVPPALSAGRIKDIILAVLHAAHGTADFRAEVLATIACHQSLRAGEEITPAEIAALLRALDAAGAPQTCPHGRPLYKQIPFAEIEKWIGRRP